MDLSKNFVFCKEAKITSKMLLHGEPFPCIIGLKKGLVLELKNIMTFHGLHTNFGLKTLLVLTACTSTNALRKSVIHVDTQNEKLLKQIHRVGNTKLNEFLNEAYTLPQQSHQLPNSTALKAKPKAKSQPVTSQFDSEVLTFVNKSLAAEVNVLRERVATNEQQLLLKNKTIEELKSRCKNIKRQAKHKEERLAVIASQTHEKTLLDSAKSKHSKSLKNLVRYYKAKCAYLKNQLETFECKECAELDETIKTLKDEKADLLEMNAEMIDDLKEQTSKTVTFYNEGKYSDNLRVCIMELLTSNVGILKIEPVLRSVFKLLNVERDKLPRHTTINEILIESRSLAHMQIAETLTTAANNCLHSDGTTKFGHKYQSYQVTTKDGPLTLGLQVQCSVCA